MYNCVRYVCVCACARECTKYMTLHGQHISIHITYIYLCVCVSLSLCLSVIVCACLIMFIFCTMFNIHLSFSHHPAYDADWFLAAPTLCLFVSYFGSFRSPLCYHESKLAHTENQTSVHQRKHMSVHKVLWLPLAIRNAEQGLVANLDKNSARV